MNAVMKKCLCMALAMILCIGVGTAAAYASETLENGNIWYGNEVSCEIQAGPEGYDFLSVYPKGYNAYEMSNHMVSTDGVAHDIPQTLIMVEAKDNYTWTPSGPYSYGGCNYEVLYCCDAETCYGNGIYYKRTNLEDGGYYSEEQAAHIRAIVTNSYPFITMEEMKQNLAEEGFAGAGELTRAEVISAVQAAIWAYSNAEVGNYVYSRTFHVPANSQWGGIMHDFTGEMNVWWPTGKRQFATDDATADRINRLINHLKNEEKVFAEKNQIVISALDMITEPSEIDHEDGSFVAELRLTLNNSGSGFEDSIKIVVTAGENVVEIPVVYGTETYEFEIAASVGDEIKAVVTGTQVLPEGAYFYSPSERGESQSLVGVAMGETAVYAEDTLRINEFSFKSGTASNISYMLINRETGEVEFIEKIDLDSDDRTAPIIEKDGYISAMFIKQSTSGLFWIAEEVNEETVDAVIECLIANNRSYKGHDEDIAFGYGDHQLRYKKKVVTYNFG